MRLKEFYNALKSKNIKTHDGQVLDFLNLLKEDIPFAFARFNDGEMLGVEKIGSVVARGDQPVNESLHKALTKSLEYTQENYYVGIPCSVCYPRLNKLAKQLVKQPNKYVYNAVALTNRNWVKFILDFPSVVKGKKILWISGADQKLDFLKNGMGLNIVGQLKFPAKDSWTHYDVVKSMYEDFDKEHDIIIVSLGPTARIFAQEMFEKYPDKTFIDIGSTFDPFTRDVWHNCHKGWLQKGRNNTKPCKICN